MLRVNPSALPVAFKETARPVKTVSSKTFRVVLRRFGLIIVACVIGCLAIAALVVTFSVPTYLASAQILIEPQRQQLLLSEPGMLDLALDNAQVESQVELLRSERITAAVVNALKLTDDPEFQREDGFFGWRFSSGHDLEVQSGDGRAPHRKDSLDKTPGDGVPPEKVQQDKAGGLRDGTDDRSASESLRVATTMLANRVGVRRVGQSYVIEITARSYKPERAAEIANAFTTAYLQDQFEAKAQVARNGVDWLQARIRDLRVTLNDAARGVEDFKARNGLAAANSGLLIEQQLGETNTQLVAAHSQTAQAAARLTRMQEVLKAGPGSAAVGEILNNQVVTNLRQQQQLAAQKEADLRERYGPTQQSVLAAHQEVEKVETDIASEMKRIAQIYLSDYTVAVDRENGIKDEIKRLIEEVDRRRQAKVTLSELEAQAQSYRRMYQNLLEKLSETAQKETLPVSTARVVAPATIPLGKNSPKTKLTLALGGVIGLLLGIGIGVVRHSTDRTIRGADDIQRENGLDCLGLLPMVGKHGPFRKGRALGLETASTPFSPFIRALRGVKVEIDVAREGNVLNSIGVASISPGEGKTSIALNLAVLLAQSGSRTLIIDADLLNGGLTRIMAPDAETGLLEMLIDQSSNAVRRTAVQNLDLLPVVLIDRVPYSSDILRSKQMQMLLGSFATTYESVILDLTAMREAVDVRAISRHLDGMLLVAAWGETEVANLTEAALVLEAAQARILGVVLNKVRDHEALSQAI